MRQALLGKGHTRCHGKGVKILQFSCWGAKASAVMVPRMFLVSNPCIYSVHVRKPCCCNHSRLGEAGTSARVWNSRADTAAQTWAQVLCMHRAVPHSFSSTRRCSFGGAAVLRQPSHDSQGQECSQRSQSLEKAVLAATVLAGYEGKAKSAISAARYQKITRSCNISIPSQPSVPEPQVSNLPALSPNRWLPAGASPLLHA